ncbi:rhombosortase [Marinobacter apostichopi]|uniref:rhombosortase n=1 Tax=Marinobacter apostichopi TaxID=3035454 RepID=UPI0025734409|nr:rhombosortase [Marinobacter sp. LA51]
MNELSPKLAQVIVQTIFPVLFGALAIVVWASGSEIAGAFQYQRDALIEGQYWRLLTGHWVHLGWQHLTINLGGLAVIWLLFGDALNGIKAWVMTAGIALFTSACLLFGQPEIQWYVGLSGLLHGLLAAGALLSLRAIPVASSLALVLLVGKLSVELAGGGSNQMEAIIGGPILIEAHLFGALGGVLCVGVFALSQLSNSLNLLR